MEPGEAAEERPKPAAESDPKQPGGGALSAAQRRAEIRRRKLLQNSEERMHRIVGKAKSDPDSGSSLRSSEPRFHLDLDPSQRPSPFESSPSHSGTSDCSKPLEGAVEEDPGEVRQVPRGDEVGASPRRGLQKYLSRFDDAMKLRGQLANEKPAHDSGAESEEFDAFRVFRLIGSVLLALFVRVFVCKYLSIFAPFLTLELAYMGLSQYFPKVEKRPQTTVLTAALLLSGIPAEVINRSMDTYRRMGDVFADLCVYFFTFILSHEVLLLYGSESP
ncbi:calcium signal-modulating cyclophilin ligand isoform X2 [Periophthalmus magnuspinnatus]|uniref:calcium signal-modulating cyclophilin ligand isoform X1 n=1 Tax=Periophthalmus magnuspinnatus TaxID=409849 RepID=UPI00145A5AA4|nr:calcium signal-modulating cyclophilin ligand isoform X1 [Periophthalmus magnuspinnatus]XP_055082627.1 calcium signal-modulating cyclophilin ligand isoform X2 [Periophthalmus magnuspinnatus]